MKDSELGKIVIKKNGRAKSFTARVRYGVFHITAPSFVSEASIREFIAQNRKALMELKVTQSLPLIQDGFSIQSDAYDLYLKLGKSTTSSLSVEDKAHTLLLNRDFNFDDANSQQWLRKVIEETLVTRAKQVFPPVLRDLANKHSLFFLRMSINRAKTRWGSCSSRQSINLSCYTLLLPSPLIRYVMLHELTHTIHMNHGEKFWALLNQLCEGKAEALNAELQRYKMPF
ncbi:MAG: M48 family metallopeptidase [Bacteroidales bacterium]|nr:M48 family metallopeptidase [Bacteroidales bacterium]